jgi:hypothetical protein
MSCASRIDVGEDVGQFRGIFLMLVDVGLATPNGLQDVSEPHVQVGLTLATEDGERIVQRGDVEPENARHHLHGRH